MISTEWGDSEFMGTAAVDDEYRALFQHISNLRNLDGQKTDEADIEAAISSLSDHIQRHFGRQGTSIEPSSIETSGSEPSRYGNLVSRKQEHNQVLLRVLGCKVAFQANPTAFDHQAFAVCFGNWLNAYIYKNGTNSSLRQPTDE